MGSRFWGLFEAVCQFTTDVVRRVKYERVPLQDRAQPRRAPHTLRQRTHSRVYSTPQARAVSLRRDAYVARLWADSDVDYKTE